MQINYVHQLWILFGWCWLGNRQTLGWKHNHWLDHITTLTILNRDILEGFKSTQICMVVVMKNKHAVISCSCLYSLKIRLQMDRFLCFAIKFICDGIKRRTETTAHNGDVIYTSCHQHGNALRNVVSFSCQIVIMWKEIQHTHWLLYFYWKRFVTCKVCCTENVSCLASSWFIFTMPDFSVCKSLPDSHW